MVHHFSGDVGLVAVGFFDPAPGAAPAYALVGQQHVPILAIASSLHLDRLPRLQREWAIQFCELLRRDQPFGLAAQIHDHAEVGHGHHLAGLDFALCGCLMRRGVLLHELFHLCG